MLIKYFIEGVLHWVPRLCGYLSEEESFRATWSCDADESPLAPGCWEGSNRRGQVGAGGDQAASSSTLDHQTRAAFQSLRFIIPINYLINWLMYVVLCMSWKVWTKKFSFYLHTLAYVRWNQQIRELYWQRATCNLIFLLFQVPHLTEELELISQYSYCSTNHSDPFQSSA